MAKKYYVTLSESEREGLKEMVRAGKTQGYRIRHAQILLKLDEITQNAGWGKKIGETYSANASTVSSIAQRYVTGGLESAMGRKEQENRCRKVDGDVEAHIVAIACSEASEGRARWTLQLIADELVRLEVVESISDTAVLNALKKTNLGLGGRKSGAFPSPERNL